MKLWMWWLKKKKKKKGPICHFPFDTVQNTQIKSLHGNIKTEWFSDSFKTTCVTPTPFFSVTVNNKNLRSDRSSSSRNNMPSFFFFFFFFFFSPWDHFQTCQLSQHRVSLIISWRKQLKVHIRIRSDLGIHLPEKRDTDYTCSSIMIFWISHQTSPTRSVFYPYL